MNITSNLSELCLISKSITSSQIFSLILSTEIIIGLMAVFPNCLLLAALWRAKIYPSNLRYLLINLSICLIGQNFVNSVKATITLAYGLKDPCLLVVNMFECKMRDLPLALFSSNVFYTLLGVSVERVYCAIRYSKYDYSSSSPIIAGLFLLILWAWSIAGSTYIIPMIPRHQYLPICETILGLNSKTLIIPMCMWISLEFLPILVLTLVRRYDRYNLRNTAINRVQHTLNFRFQLIQCAQINSILLLSLILHAIFFMPTLILSLVILYGVELEMVTKWQLFHGCMIYKCIYAFVHPVLALIRNPKLRKQVKEGWCGKMTTKVNPDTPKIIERQSRIGPTSTRHSNNLTVHFNVLEGIWAAGPSRRR